MRGIMRPVVASLRHHPLLILGVLALLAVCAVLWRFSGWPLAAAARLQPYLDGILVGVLGFGLLLVMFFILWKVPKKQASGVQDIKDRLTVENTARQTLAQIIGGAVLIAGLFFTSANLKITHETATTSQQIAREGQITDRFTKAIAQLGDTERLAVRLRGIYALERIAKDSEKDHWPIMEVLTAYVRENASRPPKQPQVKQRSKGNQVPRENPPATFTSPLPLAADSQAVLTVLRRRTQIYEKGKEQWLNLVNTSLAQADLRGAQLGGRSSFWPSCRGRTSGEPSYRMRASLTPSWGGGAPHIGPAAGGGPRGSPAERS